MNDAPVKEPQAGTIQRVKNWLVDRGPDSFLMQSSLALHGKMHGFGIRFLKSAIEITKGDRVVLLNRTHYTLVPIMLEDFDHFHHNVQAVPQKGKSVLDFSKPGRHRYVRSGIELTFPGIAEDDSIGAYTHKFKPGPGMTVFDVGAHAGLVSIQPAEMVGATGRVYAFEPDDAARQYLVKNLEETGVKNVTVTDIALADKTGEMGFNMTGNMGASLVDCSIYTEPDAVKMVKTMTLRDFCDQEKCIPHFVKMDIEGAEVGLIRESLAFLKEHPIHFALDSYHRLKEGGLSYVPVEALFRSIGYAVESSPEFGEMFTWATPP